LQAPLAEVEQVEISINMIKKIPSILILGLLAAVSVTAVHAQGLNLSADARPDLSGLAAPTRPT
jgi:hypothetical protein